MYTTATFQITINYYLFNCVHVYCWQHIMHHIRYSRIKRFCAELLIYIHKVLCSVYNIILFSFTTIFPYYVGPTEHNDISGSSAATSSRYCEHMTALRGKLPVLAAVLRLEAATLVLGIRAWQHDHLLHKAMANSTHRKRLQSSSHPPRSTTSVIRSLTRDSEALNTISVG